MDTTFTLLTTIYELPSDSRTGIDISESAKIAAKLGEIAFCNPQNYREKSEILHESTRIGRAGSVDGWNVIIYDLFGSAEDCESYIQLVDTISKSNEELRGYPLTPVSSIKTNITIEEWLNIDDNSVRSPSFTDTQ